MIWKNKLFKIVLQILVLVIVGYFATGIVQSTFATNTDKNPNVLISINENGSISQSGSLFGEELLYPSTIEDGEKGIGSISGVIRINNQYKKIDVNNLGLGLIGELQIGNSYPKDIVLNSFLNNVKVKIQKGVLFSFDKTIINYTSLKDVLYAGNDEYKGFVLEPENRFSIARGSTVDLKYTLMMDKETGNELQSVTANMPIYINLYENHIIDGGDDNNGGGNDYHNDDEVVLVDEPIQTDPPHWAHDCIITLLNHGIIYGYPHEDMTIENYRNGIVSPVRYVNEAVRPDEYVTRAEAAVLIGRALGLQEGKALITGYIDHIPKWARGYIIATTEANVFKGYPFRLFKANNNITREEMIAVLTRAYKIKLENTNLELPFKDKNEISKWAEENVKAGYEKEVIVGYPDNTYKPKNNITRGETFTIICKLMGLHDEHTVGLED
ncbi:S-layer homology domain-containing protein [Tissierella sp.]|uniref:S-layer homology domain-containing protein n=1 Tax=Tissierella sp. TaxID=41274 RepID=UPI0028612E1D|nr:S-layer homology domain-containing protein [Tissierella sp.]MDR7855066.1 S-layer homology domain-containing protein [Tissierella sp.]